MNKDYRTIIIRPLVTEKGYAQVESHHAYPFEVAPTANKIEIRLAVEKLFKVRVLNVTTMARRGKVRGRMRRSGRGKTKDWKKAVVTIHADDRIDIY